MEYLKSIRSINNNIDTNITNILLYTNIRTMPIDLNFKTKQHKDCISFKYSTNIKDICKELNISTIQYFSC